MSAKDNKRQATAATASDTAASVKKQKVESSRLSSVYIVFSCDTPVRQSYGVDHDTQDTYVIGVYASLKAANEAAIEATDGDPGDDDSDDVQNKDQSKPFSWQEESYEDTARRIWVEKEDIKY